MNKMNKKSKSELNMSDLTMTNGAAALDVNNMEAAEANLNEVASTEEELAGSVVVKDMSADAVEERAKKKTKEEKALEKQRKKTRRELYWERNRKSGGYLIKRDAREWCIRVFRAILLFGMCFLILQPILNKISISFMEERDLYDPMVISIPAHFTKENYLLAAQFMGYWKTLLNTVIVSLTIAVIQITVCTFVGYGFARFDFPFKKFWFACAMATVIIPPQTISTSLYLHFNFFDVFGLIKLITGHTINLRGSAIPYYLMSIGCMGLKNGLYIFMIRQFFRNIPKELEEAAYVDGCGIFKTFVRILLPDAKPILTSCFLFAFVWQWTDSFYSKMFLGNVKLLSIQLCQIGEKLGSYLQYTLHQATGATVGYTQCIVSTGTLMVIAPILILYLFAQRGFVESLSSTGIKM